MAVEKVYREFAHFLLDDGHFDESDGHVLVDGGAQFFVHPVIQLAERMLGEFLLRNIIAHGWKEI